MLEEARPNFKKGMRSHCAEYLLVTGRRAMSTRSTPLHLPPPFFINNL
jgi:hypothetical protein